MSRVIQGHNTKSQSLEGTPEQVAMQLFEKIIAPNTAALVRQKPEMAHAFAYHILGLAISQYAELTNTDSFEKTMNLITENIVKQLKKERKELKS